MKDNTIKLADVLFGEENRSFFDFLKYPKLYLKPLILQELSSILFEYSDK